jgi:ubiquinone biosynthesis protein
LLDDGQLGLLDCGKVGRVDERSQDEFINIVQAFMTGDADRLTDEILQMCDVPPDIDRSAYSADVAEFVAEYRNKQGAELEISRAFTDMFSIIRRYYLAVPGRVSLLLIVIGQLEGTARLLDPDFNLTEAMGNYRNELIWKRFSPERLLRQSMRVYRDYDRLIRSMPRDLFNIMGRLERGELKIQVQQNGLDGPTNRLIYALVICSLILASSLLLGMQAPPTLWGISVFGFLALMLAFFMGVYLSSAFAVRAIYSARFSLTFHTDGICPAASREKRSQALRLMS